MTYDFLIIGSGLAGSLLGHFLERRGASIFVLDAPQLKAATDVAAGIINPITGRRFVRSWRIDELLPFARDTYRQLEAELGITIYHERPLLRTLFNRGDENDWLVRAGDPGFEPYLAEQAELGAYAQATEPAYAYGQVKQAAQVDVGHLTYTLREQWRAQGHFRSEAVDYVALQVEQNQVRYGDLSAPTLVFCEGWRARFNPFFRYLPHGGNKGEVLIVHAPELQAEAMLKHRVFIVPLGEDRYWIGATSENQFATEDPTPGNGAYLRERLDDLLKVPYTVEAHRAAVRPTVRDRRPLLGRHPEWPALAIFNGLGTKGASLGPYWADHLAAYLMGERGELDPAVDIGRFLER